MNAFTSEAVPPGVVTVTSFAPTVPVGVKALMVVEFTTTTPVAAAVPTFTLLAPDKFVPMIVISLPPNVEPNVGVTELMVGVGMTNVNATFCVVIPPGVVTTMGLGPAVDAGVTAVICVAESTSTLVAGNVPMVTLFAPIKLVPVMVIAVPPKVVPEVGVTDSIVGAGIK